MMSFSQLAVQRMRQLCPHVPAVYLIEDSVPLRFRDGSLPRGIHTVGLDIKILRRWPETVERQRARGHEVYVWTVDEPSDVGSASSWASTRSSVIVPVWWSTQ